MLKLATVSYTRDASRRFEVMGRRLVVLRVDIGEGHLSPYHWILEDGRKPGLDVALSWVDGRLYYFKFFLMNERADRQEVDLSVDSMPGLPMFETNNWSDNQPYVFEQGIIDSVFNGRNLFLLRSGYPSALCIKVCPSFDLLFTSQREFSGAVVREMTDAEIQSLKDTGVA